MHHKFIVIDFNTNNARVYTGSYNFSEPADTDNGENLLLIKDRTVATSYMIEALRMYDHYLYRSAQEAAKSKGKGKNVLELQYPPTKPTDKPWWQKDWDDPIRRRDRELFSE
jgi:phosphatidylserine/phosphatidylglycerophosphate/cardiolipin synthase-like enzyme